MRNSGMIFKISIESLCLFKSRLLKDVRDMNRENLWIVDGRQTLLTFYTAFIQACYRNLLKIII